MMTRLDLNLILRETDVENLVASRMSLEPYTQAALQIGEALSRLNPEEFTKKNITDIVSQVWKQAFSLDSESLKHRIPAFSPIVARIIQEVDRAQELDPS
jgi:hypothetical protein